MAGIDIYNIHKDLMAFFTEQANQLDVPIAPTIMPRKNVSLTKHVYHELTENRMFQVSMDNEGYVSSDGFDYWFSEMALPSRKIDTLTINLRSPINFAGIWEIRSKWLGTAAGSSAMADIIVDNIGAGTSKPK